MKRIFCFFLLCILLLGLLCGCGPEGSGSNKAGLDGEASGALVEKTVLTIASVFAGDFSIQNKIAGFNRTSENYRVELIDYTEDGTKSLDDAIKKLNIDLTAGNSPDMLALEGLYPSTYTGKGVLYDLNKLIEQDKEIDASDIVIYNALNQNGALYYVADSFCVDSVMGKYSSFGESNGWSFNEYLEIDHSTDTPMMYNISKETFLEYVSEGYVETAVDWEKGTCDFLTDEFIEILNTANGIDEDREDLRNMNFTPGAVRVAEGTLISCSSFIDSVTKMVQEETLAKEKLSFIGWPTFDKSNGSRIYLGSTIGICAGSEHIDAAWDFVKSVLTMENAISNQAGIPVFRPALERAVDGAVHSDDPEIEFTEQDAQRLTAFLESLSYVKSFSNPVMSIVMEEAEQFFMGNKSAEETAELINDRVGLLVAEQR